MARLRQPGIVTFGRNRKDVFGGIFILAMIESEFRFEHFPQFLIYWDLKQMS